MKTFDPSRLGDSEKPFDLLSEPLRFIRAEHDRQFRICDELDELFNSVGLEPVTECAGSLRTFLSQELPRHILEEEDSLFPILARRCVKYDGLEVIFSQLMSEHEADISLIDPILEELDAVIETGRPRHPDQFQANARAFTETQRRHLLWENTVVLPLAETQLTAEDKNALGNALAARRRTSATDR